MVLLRFPLKIFEHFEVGSPQGSCKMPPVFSKPRQGTGLAILTFGIYDVQLLDLIAD
jgi:hypothetical protein